MIWAIGDLHFDPIGDKPMDIFGPKWVNHKEKIISHWKYAVHDEDLVLLVGDISWGLKLEEAYLDLKIIDSLPGKKIISKGNHDYWWASINKMDSLGLKTINFLNNNSYKYKNIEIFGSRGWYPKDTQNFTEKDEKIFNREVLRINNSFNSSKGEYKKIAMIHYPPFNQDFSKNDFSNIFTENKVDICIYGHLHAEGHRFVVEGEIDGVNYKCVSSDYVDFKLQEIKL